MKYWVVRLITFTLCTRLREVKEDCARLHYSLSLDLEQYMANSTEQIHSSEADSSSAAQDCLHYCVHNGSPTVPVTRHMNPVHRLLSYFFETHFNIILQSVPRSTKCSLPFRSPNQYSDRISSLHHVCRVPHPSHSAALRHPNSAVFRTTSLNATGPVLLNIVLL